jgi:hypothetical protein
MSGKRELGKPFAKESIPGARKEFKQIVRFRYYSGAL